MQPFRISGANKNFQYKRCQWVVLAAAVAAILVLAGPESAHAKSQLQEVSHRVDVRRSQSTAHLTVTRKFRNGDGALFSPTVEFNLPMHAALKAFRVRHKGAWRAATLLPISKAWETYDQRVDEVKTPTVQGDRLLALLTLEGNSARLRLPVLARGQELAIKYELVMPTCYRNGRYHLNYPSNGRKASDPKLFDRRGNRLAETDAFAESDPALPNSGCHSATSPRNVSVALEPKSQPSPISVRRASLAVGDHVLERLELEVAKDLMKEPVDADIVFVVDASKSVGRLGIERQLHLVHALAEQFRGGMAQVVVYRRKARKVLDVMAPTKDLAGWNQELHRSGHWHPGNGSRLDRGLALAASILRKRAATRKGYNRPRRIIAFTDTRLRWSWDKRGVWRALSPLPPNTIMHFVSFAHAKGHDLERTSDDVRLTPLAEKTGGITVHIDGDGIVNPDAVKHLVTPQRIEHVSIQTGGRSFRLDGRDVDYDENLTLRPGVSAGQTRVWPRNDHPKSMWAMGKIWGRKFRLPVRRSAVLTRDLGALSAADHSYLALDEKSQRAFLRNTPVLSDEMSFLASDGRSVEVDFHGLSGGGAGYGST